MALNSELMQKNGLMATLLAREFITKKIDDRINTVSYYAQKYSYGRGTVQNAMGYLKQAGAVELVSRGHMGTFIKSLDYEKLWVLTSWETLMGVMPLPYSRLYEGLATGLYKSAQSRKIPFTLSYMRGAKNRIDALQRDRYDFAVISKFAYIKSIDTAEIEMVMDFGKYSYVNEHAVVFSQDKNEIQDGMIIGIDKSSPDLYYLTLEVCKGKKVIFKELPYNQILTKLLNKELSAAIWNMDEINDRKIEINTMKIELEGFNMEDTNAVIVVKKGNDGVKNLLLQVLEIKKVAEYQKKVLAGKMIPNY
ncbi:MAG TPA: GntR family transcriptional regulator YhfZ [Petrotogaceae bacterium]|jgi:hypothetical protein|nr:GntR family transcriptional regulator YhfZ [Petrotogaceae bacterium]HOG34146.1 GntR family transcriptional regulator YhfZ [Petrotogaceae bacterium]HPA93976.1 GntR family transcriptional regulator YhfZ [Petrotogaceae bacterium]HPG47946.1 GntR family transcriptional regulator YhfZ [Petrotogaceae bacterium]HPO26448.1 GntR family transcriptional regulator YhfZ [Petrotogaceae bacterium]